MVARHEAGVSRDGVAANLSAISWFHATVDPGADDVAVEGTGSEVIEMVLSDTDDWDRYQASQWRNVSDWLVANPDDPQADEFRLINQTWKQAYLDYGRRRWGWGVFVLRA